MNQDTDAGVGDGETGRAEQPWPDAHHAGGNQRDWPPQSGGEEGEPPPAPEHQAEQDQCRDQVGLRSTELNIRSLLRWHDAAEAGLRARHPAAFDGEPGVDQ
jgi:hypothetical protein